MKNKSNENVSSRYSAQGDKYDQSQFIFLIILGGTAFTLISIYFTHKEPKFQTYTKPVLEEGSIVKFREKALEKQESDKQSLKNMFQKDNSRMLKYVDDPNALKMLLEFTIHADIKLYYVKPEVFYEDEKLFLKQNNFQKLPIRSQRVNTRLTHIIEIERCLKTIFVRVEDVLKQIEQTGTYEPPGVFMKFFGYIYFRIRKKPIIIENLVSANEYISVLIQSNLFNIKLFDLFFRYQSPIPFFHNELNQFQLKMNKDVKALNPEDKLFWIGNANFNNKYLPKIYLQGNVKNVFMQRPEQKEIDEKRYHQVWKNHFKIL